jgi:hypothetical protein
MSNHKNRVIPKAAILPVDKICTPVVQSGQMDAGKPADVETVEAAPTGMIQGMLNHRRMLIGMLAFTEKSLIRAGVKIKITQLNQ